MGQKRTGWTIQEIQQRFPAVMWPLAWLDAVLTPRRWGCAIDRAASAITHALVVDSTRAAAIAVGLFAPLSRWRVRALEKSPVLMHVDWRLRRFIWSVTWAFVVVLRLWPRKVPVPVEETAIRLIPAPASYSDFQADALVVPSDVPCAEQTLMGSMTVQWLHFMQDLYPVIAPPQPVASTDPRHRLRDAYSWVYRLVRKPPVWHPQLEEARMHGNLLGLLAVGGPFAKLLESTLNPAEYCIDLEYLRLYPVRAGLARLGCKIHFAQSAGKLQIAAIACDGRLHRPGESGWEFLERIALCSLVTHTTVWRHGMQYHVAGLAPFPVLTQNLPPSHPVRRLLAAHITETISTNFHTHTTLRRSGFDVTGFSFSYDTILRYYNDGARYFEISRLDPRVDIARRKIPDWLDYPYRNQSLMYFELFENYVREYIDYYYVSDEKLAADIPLRVWFDALDHYIAHGIRSYVPSLTKANLIKLCALFIYSVTVEHEENTMWNYAVFLPTTVRSDHIPQSVGEVQSVMNFQMVISSAANKLMRDFSHVALDGGAAQIMREFQSKLARLQREMETGPDWYWRIYPEDLEASVSA
jgi:hypothetical protein